MTGANHSRRCVAIDGLILRPGVKQRIDGATRQAGAADPETQGDCGDQTDGHQFPEAREVKTHEVIS
jgi:hypothetical protein